MKESYQFIRKVSLLLFLSLTFCSFQVKGQTKVVAYIPNWIDVNSFSGSFDFSKITHLNIAFENPDQHGELSYNIANNLLIEAAKAKNVKVLVSIAGGGVSVNPEKTALYFDLISDAKRAGFVQKISDYLNKYDFDGLDVDLEGNAINKDYDKFIKELSSVLKPEGMLLTAALSHINGGDRVLPETYQYFDFINIMAYDSTGPWRPNNPGQHSSFAFAQENVNFWLEKGLPKEKAILGVPFYGYGFGESFNEGMAFAEIIEKYPGAENLDQVANTIYYNGIPTIKAKTQLVVDQKYGGVMIWQIAQDAKGPKSLLSAIHEVLKTTNPTGIKKGFLEKNTPFFPNPVQNRLILKDSYFGHSTGQINLLDAGGKALLTQERNGTEHTFDLLDLAPGLYFVQVNNNRHNAYYKIIKN